MASENNNHFNQDELQPPQWLNTELFTKIIRQYEKDDGIVVKTVDLTPASMKGDHYASVMFRAAVEYEQRGKTQHKSLIIKTMPELEGNKKEMLQESFIFETEIAMYTEILPKFEQLLHAAGDANIKLGAPCVYHSLSPKKVIVFADLLPMDYTVIRKRNANIDEVKIAYVKLAKLHAVSFMLNASHSAQFDKYCHGLMTLQTMMENDFMTGGLGTFIDSLEEEPSLRQYKCHLEPLNDKLLSKCRDSYTEYKEQRQLNTPYVLCHGDFHVKNMMFKHNAETGQVKDVMLLDYQLSFMGTPALDLIYSFYMLLDAEMRVNKRDELIHFYHENFVATLTKIGYKGEVPKLSALRAEIMRHKHFEIFLLVTFLPMWYGFLGGEMDPDEVLDSVDIRTKLYKRKEYIAELEVLLPRFLHLGYFEH